MLVISLVTLFIGSSFLPLFSNNRTSVIPICPGSSIWDTKSYCTFVPTVTPYQAWRKAFLVEECKSLSPRDLLKEALSFGVCLLAEEPKSLVATPLPVCPVSSCPLHVFPLPSCPLVSLPSPSLLPPAPLPPVCNTGCKPNKSFAVEAKDLSKEHRSGLFYPDNETMLFITSLSILYIIGNRLVR